MGFPFPTKAAVVKTARWSTVPAVAAAAIAMAAAPALANASAARISTTTASVSHGQVTVGGIYQCAHSDGTGQLRVTVVGEDHHSHIEATRVMNVGCAGSVRTWHLTLGANRRDEQFSAGQVRVEATLVNPHSHHDDASSSRTLYAR